MLNLFGSNAFARKRKGVARPVNTVSAIESLESRIVLAGQVSSLYSNGNLTLSGSGAADNIVVSISSTNIVTISSPGNVTPFTGAGAGPFLVTGNLTINLGNGDDILVLQVNGSGGAGSLDSGNLSIDLGAGNDNLTTADLLTFTGNVSILGGTGNDTISLGSDTATVSAYKLNIDGGTDTGGANNIKTINLSGVVTGSDVSIKNGATAPQTITMGADAANTIGGNLTIVQSTTVSAVATISTSVTDTNVAGNLSVTHGNSTAPQVISVIANTGAVTIGGTTSLTNGASVGGTVNLTGTSALTFSKNLTVKNNNASAPSAINVVGVIGNGVSSTFTNGTSPINSITFSGTTRNSFTGTVTATNGAATSGTNTITASRLSSTKAVSLVNGSSTGGNAITIGGAAGTDAVAAGGNLVVTNGAAPSATNTVTINRLDADANVTVNGASTAGPASVTIGSIGAAPNTIDGNLSITNQASTGGSTRSTTINQLTVIGRSGISIFNVGAGNTDTSIGGSTLVSASGGVSIQDGTGTANVTLNNLTTGKINYTDLGGGVDTLVLAGAGTLTVNGVTRIETGNGNDTVSIADTGTAIFNGLVSISLGSGNDTLTIGDTAASPAFSTANNFRFDGGSGNDSVFASPLSIADYVIGTVIGKLKSKIAGFETVGAYVPFIP